MASLYAPYRQESAWLSPRPLLHVFRARTRLLLLTTGAVFAALAALIFCLPKEYTSRMQLLLMSEQNDAMINANSNALAGRVLFLHEAQINSEIEMLRSTNVLTRVVLKNGLQKLEMAEDHTTGETSPLSLERAVTRLRSDLSITPLPRSNILQVAYVAPTPELANAVLKSLADAYPERRLEVRAAPATYTFLQRQSVAWRTALAKAEDDLVRCRRLYSGFVLPEERAVFARQAVEAQAAMERADAEVTEYAQKVRKEREELAQLRPTLRPAMSSSSRHSRKPQIVPADYTVQRVSDEDVSAMHKDLLVNQAQLAALQAMRDRLKQVAGRYRTDMFQLAGAAIEHDSLLRQVKQSEDFYLLYTKQQEDTRIADALAHGQLANVSLADGPTLPVEPSSPRVLQDLLLSFLCAFGCGVAAVFLVEALTPGHMETYTAVKALTLDVY